MRYFSFLTLLGLFILPALPAQTASSDWHHIEGGSIRIVTEDMPDAAGELRGALEIRLKPGWKTYWRDPGASGIPPTVEMEAGTQAAPVTISFPAPTRFDDGYALWAGYDQPVSLALTITLPDATPSLPDLDARIFLGICETICIPVSTTLTLDPDSNVSDFTDLRLVDATFAALPQPEQPDFSAKLITTDDKFMLIEVEAPEGLNILDLFVSGTQALTLDMPQKIKSGAQMMFRVPILARSAATSNETLVYTLVTDNGSVSGQIRLP